MFQIEAKILRVLMAVGMAASLLACNKMEFGTYDSSNNFFKVGFVNELFMPYGKSGQEFKQDQYAKNTVSVQFQVNDPRGPVSGVSREDLIFMENGLVISGITLTSTTSGLPRKADIIFVIDETGSMQPYIDQVKLTVTDFVNHLADTNIIANLCLVTFRDEVDKVCSRFVEDDPATPGNENLNSFLDDLSRVQATGGGDLSENQLGALMAAAEITPWHSDAQRIAILMTDAFFHSAPNSLGDAPNAPSYKDALEKILDSKMKTFAVAPQIVGYSSDFPVSDTEKLPPFATASGGNWYNFSDVINGTTTMADIFNSIVDSLRVVYTAQYVVDDNSSLDPTLPVSDRTVTFTPINSANQWTFTIVNTSSTLPTGRPEYKRSFDLGVDDVLLKTLKVTVNGRTVSSGYRLEDSELRFDGYPPPGSTIRVEYLREHLRDNLSLLPIPFSTDKAFTTVEVEANGVSLRPDDFSYHAVDSNGNYLVDLSADLFKDSDPLGIAARGGLKIEVYVK